MAMLDTLFGTRCRQCGSRGVRPVGSVAPTQQGRFHVELFNLQLCSSCDIVYLDPAPTPDDLRTMYEESVQFSDGHYTDPEQVAKILEYYHTAVRDLQLLTRPAARMLEIGAGLAWVARVCKNVAPQCRTVAQDVSRECANVCTWVDRYHVGTVDQLTDEAAFDLISLTHVIEHLVDPAAMLGAIAARLAPGGKVFITAPYRPVGWTRAQGIAPWKTYSYLHVPAHVTYLSERWFQQQAGRHGLKLTHWDPTHEDGQSFGAVLTNR